MIQKVIKLSDLPILSKLLGYGKTIVASDKKNYQIELNQIKGPKIIQVTEAEASHADGERKNVIRIDFDNISPEYLTVYNGTDGDKGKEGDVGPKGDKGESANMNQIINRAGDALRIANDDVTNESSAVWSAYRGKVMGDFLRSVSEIFMTDEEYQLLFNEEYDEDGRPNDIHQVFIDLDFVTNKNDQSAVLINRDTKSYKTYIKYWTYEDESAEKYYIYRNNTYEEVVDFDLWNDLYLNPENTETYYTRKLVITEVNPVTGDVISSEYVYTPLSAPVWLDLEFTTVVEDENCILLNSDEISDDGDVSKEQKEEEIIIVHRPITSISIDGDNHITIPINSILTKAINIQPTDYLNSPICIEYDETKVTVFEDGRIMALENNCNTVIKIYSQENPNLSANIYVNVVTYVEKIELNMQTIKGFKGVVQQISANILPESASNKEIVWSSSNDEIASVEQDGTITLLDVGQVTIYASSTDGSDVVSRIDVIVDTAVSNIIVDETYEVLVGKPTVIHATVEPDEASNKNLIWTTSEDNISVGAADNGIDGMIYLSAKVNGTVTITPEDGYVDSDGHSVSKTINIIGKNPVTNITLNAISINLDKDEEYQLIATINPDADNKNVIWTSENSNIVSVDSTGKVKAISGGNDITITCTAQDGSGTSASCKVTSVILITRIILDQNINLYTGNTYNINYTIEPINANIRNLTWYTSDPTVATVNNNGIITGIKEGNIKVYAMANDNSGIIASANVNVTVPTSQLLLSNYELTMNVDDVYTLIATVEPDNTSNQNLIYESLNPEIASIDNNGNITAISIGTTSIFVKTTDGTKNEDNTPLSEECIINVL